MTHNNTLMFKKILIANRGEIACRIIKTAKRMGILTVAVYSDADKEALHVQMADEAIYLGPSPARESYLLMDKVIAAAKLTGAQAIHPGYGFLSENADFCRLCHEQCITFVGPPVEAIEAMGSKSAAKTIMEKAKVPLVPGYHGDEQTESVLKKSADNMGYPVLLKATAGGGGKGMRQVWSEDKFSEELAAAKRESLSSFGDDRMLVEKYLTQPRHVEIQVFCDNHSEAVYVFERDCSVQRRHQKVIEEAPAFSMPESLRKQMGESAIKSAQAIGYQGAGTVEFLLDKDGSFYFMEMNTRLQVEHPVTEMISGQDLVEWQLRIAAGEPLPKQQHELTINGHSFEARIYAEDANNEFLPATGQLLMLKTPEETRHVRIDTGVQQGDEISVFYDPMIAKLIVWDENRDKALQRLVKALGEYRVHGIKTNIDFLYNLASCQPFNQADIDTGFIEKHHNLIFKSDHQLLTNELAMAALYLVLQQEQQACLAATVSKDPYSPWYQPTAWRLNEANEQTITLAHNDTNYSILIETIIETGENSYSMTINDTVYHCRGSINGEMLTAYVDGYKRTVTVAHFEQDIRLFCQTHQQQGVFSFTKVTPDYGNHVDDKNQGGLTAPMNGTIVSVLTKAGEIVEKGQPLIIMEAMKMEHTIRAPNDGTIEAVYFQVGEMVDGGSALIAFGAEGKE